MNDVNDLMELWEKPAQAEYMIVGWHQWADAGKASSGLPHYLIEHTQAQKIGEIRPDGFYLFQIPGTHHLLRPTVRLKEGYVESLEGKKNEFFYSDNNDQGFLIFLGEEPQRNVEQYVSTFLDAVEELGVKRVAAVAGVYGAVPYDRDRNISCAYSLPQMKEELSHYAIRFSNYEGGASIGTYLADKAESRGIGFFALYALVPSYDFSKTSTPVQPIAIDEDFKAWYDLMRRLDHMFGLGVDLSDLAQKSDELISRWDDQMEQIARAMPELDIKKYMEQVNEEFAEMSLEALSDIWEEALGRLFDDSAE